MYETFSSDASALDGPASEPEKPVRANPGSKSGYKPVSCWLSGYLSHTMNQPAAIPTGIKKLDTKLFGGWRPGLHVLSAPPGYGKTSIASQFALSALKAGHDVVWWGFELSRYDQLSRFISRISNDNVDFRLSMGDLIGADKNMNDGKMNALTHALAEIERYSDHLYIFDGSEDDEDESSCNAVTIGGFPTSINLRSPLVVVDYLQSVPSIDSTDNDTRSIDRTCRTLRDAARHFDIPILLLSSLNREGDPKGSTNILHDATSLLTLHYTNLTSTKQEDIINEQKANPRRVTLSLDKNRNGAVGQVRLVYYTETGLFLEETFGK